ncbi:hypothetical protein FRC08_014134 [Ceratobasidium sp. 394]|nr:hypothetical protein FRC08_014134 [Ceratobasidium sp. 394]
MPSQLKIGPATVLVLTDMTVVKELMERRSRVTVGRPFMYGPELVTEGMHIALGQNTEDWQTRRRVIHDMLTQRASAKHIPLQRAESAQLLHDCVTNPNVTILFTHIYRYAYSVILSILFGQRASRLETQVISDFIQMEDAWQKVLAPGAVDPAVPDFGEMF